MNPLFFLKRKQTTPLAEMDLRAYHDARMRELPEPFVRSCIDLIAGSLSPISRAALRAAVEEDPQTWWALEHFNFGMSIRNQLRQAGYKDDQLPSGNWDDYYVPILEAAVGARSYPGDYATIDRESNG
jgi:hypothetical protein